MLCQLHTDYIIIHIKKKECLFLKKQQIEPICFKSDWWYMIIIETHLYWFK